MSLRIATGLALVAALGAVLWLVDATAPRTEARVWARLAEQLPAAEVEPASSARSGGDDTIEQLPGSVMRFHFDLPGRPTPPDERHAPRLRGQVRLGSAHPGEAMLLEVRLRSAARGTSGEGEGEGEGKPLVSDLLSAELSAERDPFELDVDLGEHAGEMVALEIGLRAQHGAPEASPGLVWSGLRIEGGPPPRSAVPEPDAAAVGARERETRARNVLLVVFDTLRADHTQPYGSQQISTPTLARLAARGTTFEVARSNASWTAPAVASMLSGVYPAVHQISGTGWTTGDETKVTTLHSALPYLPDILHERGFATVAIVKNPFFHPVFGYGRGFEQVHPLYLQEKSIRARWKTPEEQADAIWEQFLAPALVRDDGRPSFVYLHEIDPHQPYEPLPPYDVRYPAHWNGDKELLRKRTFGAIYRRNPDLLANGGVEYLKAQYAGEVTFMDAYLGRLLQHLDASDAAAHTLVVFASDHGEGLTEHGFVGHAVHLYEEVLRVPLILALPGAVPEGARVRAPVELVDLPRTLLELLGIEPPAAMQGRSLVPLLEGRGDDAPRASFAQARFEKSRSFDAIRYGRWKLIRRNPSEAGEAPAYELYDLDADPGELASLAQTEPIVAGTLRQMLAVQQLRDAARRESRSTDVQPLDAEMRRNLEALGYLQ